MHRGRDEEDMHRVEGAEMGEADMHRVKGAEIIALRGWNDLATATGELGTGSIGSK
jgi:hypothetical protein